MADRRFPENESLRYYQRLTKDVYTIPSDRYFSVPDLLMNQQRFTMRALKGIRKGDQKKLVRNLLIAFCWGMAIPNRFQFDIEDLVWRRFPMLCSYCGTRPCSCRKMKPTKRLRIRRVKALRPKRLLDFQKMFLEIYPPETRTLQHAGVHLGEEMGEVSEAVHTYFGEHKKKQLEAVKEEIADYLSCIFGVANSAGINIARESAKMFSKNCYVCHKIPCECAFSFISTFKS